MSDTTSNTDAGADVTGTQPAGGATAPTTTTTVESAAPVSGSDTTGASTTTGATTAPATGGTTGTTTATPSAEVQSLLSKARALLAKFEQHVLQDAGQDAIKVAQELTKLGGELEAHAAKVSG